jgi:DNA polymerase-3 subunit gamma/tau
MAEQQEYQVTARKWRPTEFDSVVGQEHVTQTLRNAIRSGRIHHAYLFSGPRGVGKTTTARILAKALNCQNLGPDAEPCNVCDSCRAIVEGRSMDVVEIDGASNNSVDDIRKLRENAKYPPVNGRYKLYIIDEVHMLSGSAFNALLKTLEEPPKHLVFVFATTEPHKVPPTILSRVQRFDFRRMQIADIVGRLAFIAGREGFSVDEDALVVIAKKADGSMRDAQSIFDQVISFCGTTVSYAQVNEALNVIDQGFFFRVTDMMRSHDPADAFAIVEEIMKIGYDPQEFLVGLAEHIRNYLTVLTTGSTRLIETAKVYLDRYAEETRTMQQGDMIRALNLTLQAQQNIRTSSQPRLRLELLLTQLATMDSTVQLAELLRKIDTMGSDGPLQPGAAAMKPAPEQERLTFNGAPPSAPQAREPRPSAPQPSAPPRAEHRTSPQTRDVPPPESASRDAAARKDPKDFASFPTKPPAGNSGTMRSSYNGGVAVAEAPASSIATAFPIQDGLAAPAYGDGRISEPVTSASISIDEVRRRWQEFLGTMDDRKVLAVSLSAAQPAEMRGAILRLYVAAESELAILNRSRGLIDERLRAFFGVTLSVEGVIGDVPVPKREDAAPLTGTIPASHQNHPFIRGLIDRLGASAI